MVPQVGYFAKKLQDFSSTLRREHLSGDAPGHYAYAMALRVEDVLEKFLVKFVVKCGKNWVNVGRQMGIYDGYSW